MAIQNRRPKKTNVNHSVVNKAPKKSAKAQMKPKTVINAKVVNKLPPLKYNKNALLSELANRTNLNKKDVAKVLKQLTMVI